MQKCGCNDGAVSWLFAVLLLLVAHGLVSGTPIEFLGGTRKLPNRHKQRRVPQDPNFQDQQLSSSASILTVILSDGDVVSCVPINQQPALFSSPNMKIQLKPSTSPKPGAPTTDSLGSRTASQLFAKELGSCPSGTIPVRNIGGSGSGKEGLQTASAGDQLTHEHAFTATPIAHPPSYKGTEVLINVWQPFVEPHDFSLAQLWVMNTGLSYSPTSVNWALNTIEAGWQVYSDLYGDKQPRLFIYWTGDGYDKTGCYNLNQDCVGGTPGFVQVSNKVLIGGSIAPPSAAYSQQYEIKLRVFKDDYSGNWWLQFNNEYVGYWPSSLFHSLKDTSDLIEWGGEIINSLGGSKYTTTNMGSGELPSFGYKKAAYQRNLQYVGKDHKLYDIKDLQAITESSSCYAVTTGSNKSWGSYFYYGGKCQ